MSVGSSVNDITEYEFTSVPSGCISKMALPVKMGISSTSPSETIIVPRWLM